MKKTAQLLEFPAITICGSFGTDAQSEFEMGFNPKYLEDFCGIRYFTLNYNQIGTQVNLNSRFENIILDMMIMYIMDTGMQTKIIALIQKNYGNP